MASPSDRRYLPTHEWHLAENGIVTIGLSRFAVDELTDITYLDLKARAGELKAGQSFGEIESVKATSELYTGIDGTVTAVNQEAIDDPAIINRDPYGRGWLLKLRPADTRQVESLLTAEAYDARHG